MSELLEKARKFEQDKIRQQDKRMRPLYHVSAPVGCFSGSAIEADVISFYSDKKAQISVEKYDIELYFLLAEIELEEDMDVVALGELLIDFTENGVSSLGTTLEFFG